MKWDSVIPYRHKKFDLDLNTLKDLKKLYRNRLSNEPNLSYLQKVRKRYDENKDKKFLSLNMSEREIDKELRKSWLLDIENTRRSLLGLETYKTYKDLEDNDEEDGSVENKINIDNDYLLAESTNIVNDYLNLNKKIILGKVD